jgi:hypothetical protein
MIYHLTPVLRYRKLEPPYEGLHLGKHRLRLTQRFAARMSGVLRARVAYETGAHIICITPVKVHKGPAGADAFRISRDARGGALIHCTTLHTVMPIGRYRFVKQTPDGYICKYDPGKSGGKREGK